MTFGERITELREEIGFHTRKSFAEKLGIPETTLRNYETNAREPGHTFLKQISDLFEVSTDYLLGLTNEKERLSTHQLKESEYKHIEKYRNLDSYGKESIDLALERETQRIFKYGKLDGRKIITLAEYEPTKPPTYLIPYWEEGASAGNGIYQLNDTESIMMTLWASELTKQADFIIKVSGDSMEPDFYDGDKVLVDRKVRVEKGDVGIFWKDGNTYIKEMGENELISRNPKRANIPTDDFNRVICMGKVIGKLTDEMIAID